MSCRYNSRNPSRPSVKSATYQEAICSSVTSANRHSGSSWLTRERSLVQVQYGPPKSHLTCRVIASLEAAGGLEPATHLLTQGVDEWKPKASFGCFA